MIKEYFDNPKKLTKVVLYFVFLLISLVIFFQVLGTLYGNFYDEVGGSVNSRIDFNAYMTGASIIKSVPRKLYDIDTQIRFQEGYLGKDADGLLVFMNTPIVAFMYIPYTVLTRGLAYKVSFISQLFLSLVFILILINTFGYKKIMFPFLPLFLPIAIQSLMGQIAIVIAIVIIYVIREIESQKYFLAGILSSLLLMKLQYVILIPYLFVSLKRKKTYFLGLLLGFLTLIVLDSLIYRGFYLFDYIRFLFSTENTMVGTEPSVLLNLSSVLWSIGLEKSFVILFTSIMYFISVILLGLYNKKIDKGVVLSVAIIFSLALNLHFNYVDMIFLLIPIFSFFNKRDKLSKIVAIILFLSQFLTFLEVGWITGLVLLLIGIFLLITYGYREKSGSFSIRGKLV